MGNIHFASLEADEIENACNDLTQIVHEVVKGKLL